MSLQVIVVGGGLAGVSAAHTVLEHGGRVLLLDKNAFLGGNSVRATSGINGAGTRIQRLQGIHDTVESFEHDTAISASKGVEGPASDLAKVLTGESAPAVEWLINKFGLDLSLISRLGGHSFPRTHRGKERFPGMTITYALMERLEAIQNEGKGLARILTKARVTKLLRDGRGHVVGVEYEKDGQVCTEHGPVIIATGGYAADFTENSLLAKFRPDLLKLPTTNGDHCTGDGIKMTAEIGGALEDMEWVQVHPTGLVDLAEPDAKVKFLAAEALRGVGGLLLDAEGNRFCDELGRRDYVTGEMWKGKAPFRLVLNSAGGKEIEWHCKHYTSRGLMKHYNSGAELAADMKIGADHLDKTFATYNEVAKSPPDLYGKKFFQNLPFVMNDEFWVAIVTPVVHYCMGGVKIRPDAAIVGTNGEPIPGLWATGEVCGGVHGKNRLGGNSLLDCVVFGRVSGASAARYVLSENIQHIQSGASSSAAQRVGALSGQLSSDFPATVTTTSGAQIGATITNNGIQTSMRVDPAQRRVDMQISWDKSASSSSSSKALAPASSAAASQPSSSASSPSSPAPAAAGGGGGGGGSGTDHPSPSSGPREKKVYKWDEVSKHTTEKDIWVVVRGQVLDVTNFLKDHPGGKKAILMWGGKDATAEFDMFHKPDVIEKYAPWAVLGTIEGPAPAGATEKSAPGSSSSSSSSYASSASFEKADFSKPNNPVSLKAIEKLQPGSVQSRLSGGTADILPSERKKSTFVTETMTNVLDGGPDKTKRRRFIISPTATMDVSDKFFWDRPTLVKEHVKHFIETHQEFWDNFVPTRMDVAYMVDNAMISGSLMNHYGLFLPTILGQASDEQHSLWLFRTIQCQIIGAYAQTELGHGSNVRGLQTTATYDKSTQQFVLNTPTLRSIKWWPGALGKLATHATVYAQLILDGKEYGVHVFMLQVRDENHRPFPGIELGDVGPKLGDGGNDTGFMRLDNVRIPREYLLNRWQNVTPEGEYVKNEAKSSDKIHYATMMFTRGAMVKGASGALARAVTVAIRYSCVRTQGFADTSSKSYLAQERQIIDHQMQRYRLFKQLALTYAMKFTGHWMVDKFSEVGETLGNLENLPFLAATSAGLKGLTTFLTAQGIEDCRKCCGGNGYLLSSGIGALATDYVWQTTAEGDWIILMLQTARFLIKSLNAARKGDRSGATDYLAVVADKHFDLKKVAPPAAKSPADFQNPAHLLKLFKYRALVSVVVSGNELEAQQAKGKSFDDAWNSSSVALINAVVAHCMAFMLEHFTANIGPVQDPACRSILHKLAALYGCAYIIDDQWAGILDLDQLSMARHAAWELLDQIRPDAVSLVDAFDIPDRVINSTIGRADGNVYEALFEAALKSALNQRDPFLGYEEHLRPILDIDFIKYGNTLHPDAKL